MGNTCSGSCFSHPNTNATSPREDASQPILPSHTPQPTDIPQSSILNSIREDNTTENTNQLIKMLDDLLSKIKGKGEEASTSSGMECLASATRSASQVVDSFFTEAKNIGESEISQVLGNAAKSVLNKIGGAHFMFLGLSLVAYTLDTYLKKKSNDTTCMELLEELVELAKQVNKFKKAVPEESEKVRKAIHDILVGVVMCCDYIQSGPVSRLFKAGGMESQLKKTKKGLQDHKVDLILTTAIKIAEHAHIEGKIAVPNPSKLLDFKPEGMDEQVAKVKELLDIESSEQAMAVVIVGSGGIGKSTLAASVIESLNLLSTNFKFSMVTIDEKKSDRGSYIVQLQRCIISHFTGEFLSLQDPQLGRQKIQEAMASKSCFLYIDNVVDSYYVKELLPRELLTQNPSMKMQNTKIRIVITSRQNDLKPLLKIKNVVHHVQMLSGDTANNILSGTILQGPEPAHDFDEKHHINELAKACRSIPLLLSIFGNQLKDNREKNSYEEAIKALSEGNIDHYGFGDEELLSENLMYVYDKMKNKEAQEAFLDICTYFHGRPWTLVDYVVDTAILETLHKKMLVNRSGAGTVTVHDILRSMGAKKAKDTRLMNFQEFDNINDKISKLQEIRGMVLMDGTSLVTLETEHLNAMRDSLRFLVLGDWVRVEGRPCKKAFKNLRYLEVGDLKDLPFEDVSNMENLNVFLNRSKPGMNLKQLPQSLKHLTHDIGQPDCSEFASLPLKNLKSLKQFTVETKRSVRFPQGVRLPGSLEHLRLNSCEQLPETFGHLSALQTVSLEKCDLKCLPQEFTQSVQLRNLSLQRCTNMISLQDNNFASLCSLRDLSLWGCTRLEKLPADLGKLTALQNLDIGECQNLKELPDNFGGLKSLKTLALKECISLQRLPDSFGMLSIEYLSLHRLDSLKELPQTIGDLSSLQSLEISFCRLLEFVPDSFVHLTKLVDLDLRNLIKFGALPKNFDHLRSLENIFLWDCPRLTRLPDGFEGLKTLKRMELRRCKSVIDLPASFEMLSSLEELRLADLPNSRLPDGLGKLKRLYLADCPQFQPLPQDFDNLGALERLDLRRCPMLEGTTMDKIVKLQNCHYVRIEKSTKLIERWNELEEQNKNLPMIVRTSPLQSDEHRKELDRCIRVGLLCGECIQLDSTGKELIRHSSLPIPNNTTIALIRLLQKDELQLLHRLLEMAKERAISNSAGHLTIVYVCTPTHEDPTDNIRQTLLMLPPQISYAIPSTDIRRLSLIGYAIFYDPDVFTDGRYRKLFCFMVDVGEDDEGHQMWKDDKVVTEDEISKMSENPDEETEISDGIVEFINCICESETESPSGQCSRLPQENMVGKFIQKLKNDKIYYFSDNKVKVDHLRGKTVAIILIDQNYPGCRRLQQVYQDIILKDSNFEAIWIPLWKKKDFGFGTYSRAIEHMPWLTLPNPKLIKIDDIKAKSPRIIIINSGGSTGNPNALSLLMSRGADAYPFTKGSLPQLDLKSSLEILFHSTRIKELNNKLIFLYAEPPSQELKMKGTLEKLVQIHGKGNFEIVYVGRLFDESDDESDDESEVAEDFEKAYEDAIESMNWTKLSFEEMITFWYGCKCLSDSDEVVHQRNSASTLNSLRKAVLDEERWLVVVDGDGVVTANGMDVVEMACESSDEEDDEVDIRMRGELRESLREGKCREGVRRYFRDELNHPQHHHSLLVWKKKTLYSANEFCCDVCDKLPFYTWYWKRVYRCGDCSWDLCWDCWKEFVKEEVRRHATQQS